MKTNFIDFLESVKNYFRNIWVYRKELSQVYDSDILTNSDYFKKVLDKTGDYLINKSVSVNGELYGKQCKLAKKLLDISLGDVDLGDKYINLKNCSRFLNSDYSPLFRSNDFKQIVYENKARHIFCRYIELHAFHWWD